MIEGSRLDELRRRVQKDPSSIAFAQLAEECRRAGHHQEAVDVCEAGLALHPGYLSARVTLGRALLELDRLDDAKRELELVRKSAPENLAAIRGLAEILHRQGSLEQALEFYRAAQTLAPSDPELQETIAVLARQIAPKRAPHAADGLSFDEARHEILAHPQAQIQPGREMMKDTADPELAAEDARRDRAERTVAALERWLDAVHVARAHGHA